MNSVTFDQPLNNKKLKQIRSKVTSAIDEDTHEIFYWCHFCHDWIKGSPHIEIVTTLERTGNQYCCTHCGNEIRFERERRIYHGL